MKNKILTSMKGSDKMMNLNCIFRPIIHQM